MQSYQIIAAFSEIKSELRTHTGISKSMPELRLWFTMENGILYSHDFKNHHCCFALAIKTTSGWKIRLDSKTFGHRLVLEIVNTVSEGQIANKLIELHEKFGTYS